MEMRFFREKQIVFSREGGREMFFGSGAESGPKSGERWKSSPRPASFPQYSTGAAEGTFAEKGRQTIERS
jgi:hypothetical protein